VEIAKTTRGPKVIVSRSHPNLTRRLFELEVPEVQQGIVEIKSIAREASYRSKVAVAGRQPGIDPVGCCVGLRGIRIQNIVNELNGEKLDVVQWDAEPATFIANALSPAKVTSVKLDEKEGVATVTVPDRQLSLAIGKEGQNARLAAKLTGWKIDIKAASLAEAEKVPGVVEVTVEKKVAVSVPVEDLAATREAVTPGTLSPEAAPLPVPAAVAAPTEPVRATEVPPTTPIETKLVVPRIPAGAGVGQRGLRFAEDIMPGANRGATAKAKDKKKRQRTESEREDEIKGKKKIDLDYKVGEEEF
jgi:N utilization substance protein A